MGESLANRLRDMRRHAGLTGKNLADAAGWGQSKVSKIENGYQVPTPEDIDTWVTSCGQPREVIGELLGLLGSASAVATLVVDLRARDPNDPRPRYARLADILREAITRGALPPGAMLPGGATLSAQYNLARDTVRHAIAQLQREGLVVSIQGSGVYVGRERPSVSRAQPAVRAPRLTAGLLTESEHEAIEAAGQLATLISERVIGSGPTRGDDIAEMEAALHVVQRMVMAQAAARAYPNSYRLLGEVLPPPT